MLHEPLRLRLACFLAALAAAACAERLRPRRARVAPISSRWTANIGLLLTGAVLVRLLLPAAAVGAAVWAETHRWGLLHLTAWSLPVKLALGAVLLDFAIYWQHRLFHALPPLWRLHSVHHTDLDLDASSALRFHPLEMLVSMLVKMGAVAVFGVHFMAVTIFEVVLSASAIFNHSNLFLPRWVDAPLRLLIVTPDMHRIHHTIERDEQDSNFGFCLSWWDRLFGTYRAKPRGQQANLRLGLAETRDPKALGLAALLAFPFRKPA